MSVAPYFTGLCGIFISVFSSFPSVLSLPTVTSGSRSFSDLLLVSSGFSLLGAVNFLPRLSLFVEC